MNMAENSRKSAVIDKQRIIEPHEFQSSIQYERIRSDRFSTVFSVIFVSLGKAEQLVLEAFSAELCNKKRAIDCVGWNTLYTISILLPDTDLDGAELFWSKLDTEFIERTEGFSRSIYTYPDHWLENPKQDIHVEEIQSCIHQKDKENMESLFVFKMPIWKRFFDIIGSALLLILISPLFLLVGIYIKIVSPGPVFFHHARIGYRGIPFKFWKFRTMKADNNQQFHGKHSQSFIQDGDVPMLKLDDHDPRIIPGGKILRVSCIDELPQLWNVLKGDMSLVGPRPCIPYEAEEYLRWHTHRFDTVPGMTGLWQVSGKNKLTFKQMIRLDIGYSNNVTLFMDIKILLKTPIVIFQMVSESVIKRLGVNKTETLKTDNI